MSIDKLVEAYVALRDQKRKIDADAKSRTEKLSATMAKIEAALMAKADETGVTSFKTPHGTAYISSTDYASVADWDAVLDFVRRHERFDLLTKGVNKTAVREMIEGTKRLPPGVNYGTRLGVGIRRASSTGEEE